MSLSSYESTKQLQIKSFSLKFRIISAPNQDMDLLLEDIKGPTSCQLFTSLQNKTKVMGKLGLLILALAFKANQIAAVGLVEYRASVTFPYL